MQLVNGSWRGGLDDAGTTLGVFAVATWQSDVYVGGSFHLAGDVIAHNIARWDGTTWHDVGGGMVGYVFALAFDTAGNLYAGGSFSHAGAVAARGIAKWDGTTWSALAGGITNGTMINAITIDPGGNVYAGGDFTMMSGVAAANIAMWNGAVWSALGTGCTNPVFCLAFDASLGALYAGGEFLNAGGPVLLPPGGVFATYIARWSGGTWSALGTSVNNWVRALAVGSGGILYVAGDFTSAGGVPAKSVARWNAGTGQWSSLGSAANNTATALLLVNDQYLHVGGDFYFSIFAGTIQITYYGVVNTQGNAWGPMGYFDFSLQALAADSAGNIYAAGVFDQVQDIVAHNIAKWDGTAWNALGTANSVDNAVLSMASDGAGNTYVGGIFGWAGVQGSRFVAKWNGATWTPMTLKVPTIPEAPGAARAMALDASGTLYVSGDRGGALYAIVYRWAGASWSLYGWAIDGEVFVLKTAANGTLYVGGSFVNVVPPGGAVTAVNYLVFWNGSSYVSVGGGTNNCVSALAFDKAGNLYVGGYFTTAGNLTVNYLARWDGTAWSSLGGGTDGAVLAIAIGPAGEIYVGGGFTTAGTINASNIAKWDGTAWTALGAGVDGSVFSVVVDDLGTVVAAGAFINASGIAVNHAAKWDGTAWTPLGSGFNDDVYVLSLDSGGNLAAGGDFSTAGGNPSCFFGYYTANPVNTSPNPPGAGPPPPPPGIQPTPRPRRILWWIFWVVSWWLDIAKRLFRS
jgi:hypothetical protein